MNRTVQACRLTRNANTFLAHQLWSQEVTGEFIFNLSRRGDIYDVERTRELKNKDF